jgi:hypothetical protein
MFGAGPVRRFVGELFLLDWLSNEAAPRTRDRSSFTRSARSGMVAPAALTH